MARLADALTKHWHKLWPLLLAAVYIALIPVLADLERAPPGPGPGPRLAPALADVRGVAYLLGASAVACLLVWLARNLSYSERFLGAGGELLEVIGGWRPGRQRAARGSHHASAVSVSAVLSLGVGALRGLPPLVLWLPVPGSLSWVAATMTIDREPSADYDTALGLWLGALALFAAVFLVPLAVENWRKLPVLVRAIRWPEAAAVALIVAVAFAVRFIDLADSPGPFYIDEGDSAGFALDVARGVRENFLDVGVDTIQPTLFYSTIALSFKVFGTGVLAARLPSVLLGTAGVLLIYLALREMFGLRVALAGAAVLAVLHFHVHYSRVAIINVADTFMAALVLFWVFRAIRTQKLLDFAFAGLSIGLVYYVAVGARVLPLALVLVLALLVVRTRGAFVLRNLWGLATLVAGFAVAFLPAGLQFEQDSRRLSQRFEDTNIFDTGLLDTSWLDQQVALTGHSEAHVVWDQIQQAFGTLVVYDDVIQHYNAGVPLLDGVSGVFFVVGGVYALLHILQPRFFGLYALLVPTFILGGALIILPIASHRLLAAAPLVAAAFIGLGLVVTADAVAKVVPRWRMYATAPVVGVVVLAIAVMNLSFYFDTYVPSNNLGRGRQLDTAAMADYLEQFDDSYAVYIFAVPGLEGQHPAFLFRTRDKVLVDVREGGQSSVTVVGGRVVGDRRVVDLADVERAAAARAGRPNALFLVPTATAPGRGTPATAGRSAELEAIERLCPGGAESEPISAARGAITYQWYEVQDAQDCIGRLEGTVLPSSEPPASS